MATQTKVVDTNVIRVANEQHPEVSRGCIADCALELQSIMRSGRIAIDERFEIISEYQAKMKKPKGKGPGPGDAFVKWVLRNRTNAAKCDQVELREHNTRRYESFPEDEQLKNFDQSDRMFVAVSCAHPEHPPILEAADSKWLNWAEALKRHGVEVVFVCEDDIRRFQQRKAQKKQR
jgi:hypothetical protein